MPINIAPPDIQDTPPSDGAHPSLEMLSLSMTQTISLLMQNAVTAQQNAQITNAAVIASTCKRILDASKQKVASAADDTDTNTSTTAAAPSEKKAR